MKKIAILLAAALVFTLACDKTNKDNNKQKENEEQAGPITIDGNFDDWASLQGAYSAKNSADSQWEAVREHSIKDLNEDKWRESGPFDPTEEQTLRHIAQLKPILQEYSDVIFVLQAGFIGCWGEWHYTENFVYQPSSQEDYLPRKHVCDALLDALPKDRQVELRTPKFKMKMYGYSLADTITRAEAHQPTDKARLAGHNDCYLAGPNDQGTFNGANEKEYWKAETKYTIMGGETCELSNYCKCDNTLKSMAEQHFTYLNMSYNKDVIRYWQKNSCYDEIKKRLGYRLALTEGSFTKKPAAGSPYRVVLKIDNVG